MTTQRMGDDEQRAAEAATDLQPGELVDTYQVVRKLGEGGMGAVYQALDRHTKLRVALKVLAADAATNPQIALRFEREASAANEIDHPAFVRGIRFGLHQGRPFMAMELLDGKPLSAELSAGALTPPRAARITARIASALQSAHARGVIHRDIKPDNIFLTTVGDAVDVVRILDLGIAKFRNDTATANKTNTNALLGTPRFMSPEQCRGSNIDHRSDIYSLGVVCYHMLSGRYPIDGENNTVILYNHLMVAPVPLDQIAPWVPPELVAIVHRCLEKDPGARYQSMAELAEALGPLTREVVSPVSLSNRPTVIAPVARAAASSPSRTRGLAIVLAAVVAVAVVGVGLFALNRSSEKPPPIAAQDNGQRSTTPKPATPDPPAAATFRVWLDVKPTDATVSVDGVERAERPIVLEGPTGRQFAVTAKRDGYKALTQSVRAEDHDVRSQLTLVAEESTSAAPPAPATKSGTGTLHVNVEPWAYVSIDGGKEKETPIDVRLTAGTHKVVINNPALKKRKDLRIVMQPGQTKRIDLDLSRGE